MIDKTTFEVLDFWKGNKTIISSALFTFLTIANISMGQIETQKDLEQAITSLFSEIEIIITALWILYGLIMKIWRPKAEKIDLVAKKK